MGENNSMCWQELATRDLDTAKKFYSTVFGWDPRTQDGSPMAYTEIYLNDADGKPTPFGGMPDPLERPFMARDPFYFLPGVAPRAEINRPVGADGVRSVSIN